MDMAVTPSDIAVSIHAPVWGANDAVAYHQSQSSFNPRTRVGCESAFKNYETGDKSFNPRTRVGCEVSFVLPIQQ